MRDDARLVVVTPWYPTADAVFAGVFVREWTAALGHPAERTTIVHVHNVAPGEPERVERLATPHGEVLRIDIPVAAATARSAMIGVHRAALERHAAAEFATADVVLAHVGVPTGIAAAALVADQARLVTIEHATYLEAALRDPSVADEYERMLSRATWHLMVGEAGAMRLRRRFPAVADRILAVGNPVDDELFAAGQPRSAAHRWLYVGSLTARKRVADALPGFAEFRRERPQAAFTVVGSGPERARLEALALELGVAEAVSFAEPVPLEQVPAVFGAHDVLVHMSEHETFGLTAVEAVLTGLPVVVRRSDGPAEALDVAGRGGMVALIDEHTPATVAAAALRLEVALPASDPTLARADLVARFGARGFGERLERACDGLPWWEPREHPVVVVVAATRAGARAVAGPVREAVRLGLPCTVATVDPVGARGVGPAVTVTPLSTGVLGNSARAAGRLALHSAPAAVARGARAASRAIERVPGLAGVASRGARAASALEERAEGNATRPSARRLTRPVRPGGGRRDAKAVASATAGVDFAGAVLVPCDDRANDACAQIAREAGAVVVSDPAPGSLARAIGGRPRAT